MITLNLHSETGLLKSVILGIANDRSVEKYKTNPKYAEILESGQEPSDPILVDEIENFCQILLSQGIEVYRPKNQSNCTQIFTRDIGFVVGDTFVRAKMIHPSRQAETKAIDYLLANMNKVITPPSDVLIEGGDIILWQDYVFVGQQGERTNEAGLEFMNGQFGSIKKIEPLFIRKTQVGITNILHVDCTFQPIGNECAIIFDEGFVRRPEVIYDLFQEKNLIKVTEKEMYDLFPNIFSIAPDTVIVEAKFHRLIHELEKKGIKVIKVNYENIGKLGGLLRCSTLPLNRV